MVARGGGVVGQCRPERRVANAIAPRPALVYTYHQRTPTSGQMRNEGIEVILFVRDRLGSYKIEQTTRIT